jgi:hypothetical protein
MIAQIYKKRSRFEEKKALKASTWDDKDDNAISLEDDDDVE